MNPPLLTPEFVAKLEQLELISRKIFTGRMKGERRSKRKGTSVEFADHRNYVVGDDLRFIDWNILIRLDRLFIKLYEEEEDLHFHLLLDTSLSMDFGDPKKLLFAKRVAAALAYIGLFNLDRVMVWPFSDDLLPGMPAARGRKSLWRVVEFLESVPIAGGSDFGQSCKNFSIKHGGKGVVVVLSDLLDKRGFEAGLRYLLARQMDIYVIHILAEEEVRPELAGDLRLVDVEDRDVAEITVSAPLLARYKANVNAYCAAVKEFCVRRGITYLFTTNQVSFERLVLTYLRERGLVR
ncbi:MAG: DUF58 domain-containing protein [Planctomycetota bacterium]